MTALHASLTVWTFVIFAQGSQVKLRASEQFTDNAICRQNNCVNPVFPGLTDLAKLDTVVWQCTNHSMVSDYVDFCKDVVNYGPALPSPSASKAVREIVKEQDDAAATMFFYHLSGLGYEPQEFKEPSKTADECVKATWRMVCFTYFPKAQAGCGAGQPSQYLRPCRNACESYVEACRVECCDESVQCVFQHTVSRDGTSVEMIQTGYSESLGPSALCTGTSTGQRSSTPWVLLAALLSVQAMFAGKEGRHSSRPSFRPRFASAAMGTVLVLIGTLLQGCVVDVPRHNIGNWRRKTDYLVSYEFVEPGKDVSTAILNSCSAGVAPALQCSGRGYCKAWSDTAPLSTLGTQNGLAFCECDRDWADPECRTRRKSQVTTFLLSLFGGFLGLDLFYLGWPWWGVAKLCTLGGCGFWWVLDVVRTGAGPVYASDYRVAHDLPHWVYVLSTVTLFGLVGFLAAIESYLSVRKRKRDDLMKLQEAEECRNLSKLEELDGPRYRGAVSGSFMPRHFAGYGAAMPSPLPNAGAPYAAEQGSSFACPYGRA